MGERRGTKGLELWCRRMTEGYPGVKVENMTTSWRDGLAFCAIIHHFRPELIDFSKLNKGDIYYNNDLAFTVAEKYLGIPALLEPEDMVEYEVPDRLSILTYLSQFYKTFVASQESPARIAPKRPVNASERGIVSPASTSPPTKVAIKTGGAPRRDMCAKCALPVFLAERLNVGRLMYHRTCFRCARCNSQLSLANYYETENQNQFCCETCPDEENLKQSDKSKVVEQSVLTRSLSDEEKSAGLHKYDEEDDYSTQFETALENPDDANISQTSTLSEAQISEFSRARSLFISSQIEDSDTDVEMPPELPKTKPPDINSEKSNIENIRRSENVPKDFSETSIVHNVNNESNDSGFLCDSNSLDSIVNNHCKISTSNQLDAASVKLDKSNDFVTKDIKSTNNENPSSVRARMRLFEKGTFEKKNDITMGILNKYVSRDNGSVKKLEAQNKSPSSTDQPDTDTNISSKDHKETISAIIRETSQEDNDETTLKNVSIGANFVNASASASETKSVITPEKSLNTILQKQISIKENKSNVEDLSVSTKDTSEDIVKMPAEAEMKTETCDKYEENSYLSKSLNSSETHSKGFESKVEKVQKQTPDKEIGENIKSVNALKNLFEKSDVDVKKIPLKEQLQDITPSEDSVNYTREDTEIEPNTFPKTIFNDETKVFHERQIENKVVDQSSNSLVDSNDNESEISEVPYQKASDESHVTLEESAHVTSKHIVQEDKMQAESDSNNKFVDLVNVSSENLILKHSDNLKVQSENVSHSDNENSIIIISDNSEVNVEDSIISISDSNEFDNVPVIDYETEEVYPEELNPFGDDDNEGVKDGDNIISNIIPTPRKSVSSRSNANTENTIIPFGDDGPKKNDPSPKSPKPAKRTKIIPKEKFLGSHTDTPDDLRHIYVQRISTNPFEDDDSDHEPETNKVVTPQPRKLKLVPAPKISLNPFWSDEEDDILDDTGKEKPVPKPRKLKNTGTTPEQKPTSEYLSINSSFGSNTSISSATSSGHTVRRKKLAPKPPMLVVDKTESGHSSLTSSPSTSVQHSPRLTPKVRKNRKAPLPPTSTPLSNQKAEIEINVSPLCDRQEQISTAHSEDIEEEKNVKDEVNRNRQSNNFSSVNSSTVEDKEDYASCNADKSTYGKWKRKKGPAPSRPIPQRRMIKALPVAEVRKELDLIELQQQGLEKQGVRLEQIIRDRCEGPDSNVEDTLPIDVEDLILQLFEVVNEKNELYRRQAELMYLQRQQKLEEEHAEVEYQIRCLMLQPEANKTDTDKTREEELINRLVEIVERRNEIIDCLEMDRIREAVEDDSICSSLNTYASKREEANAKPESENESPLKKEKKKKVKKEKKKIKLKPTDIDKDIDECESLSTLSSTKEKEKKKKKFAIF